MNQLQISINKRILFNEIRNMGNSNAWIFPNYEEKIEKCNTLYDFIQLIKEVRGPHPGDDTELNENLKKFVVNDWILRKRSKFPKKQFPSVQKVKLLALHALNMEDLNFIDYCEHNKNFFYTSHVERRFFRGKEYTCEKCHQIFHEPHYNIHKSNKNLFWIDGYDTSYRINTYGDPESDVDSTYENTDEEDDYDFYLVYDSSDDEDNFLRKRRQRGDFSNVKPDEKNMETEISFDNEEPKPGCSYK